MFYDLKDVNDMIAKYLELGGNFLQTAEPCLQNGDFILYGNGLKTVVGNEIVLNEWSSATKLRFYKKTPKKYQKIIDNQ